jgi:hypothetical protein
MRIQRWPLALMFAVLGAAAACWMDQGQSLSRMYGELCAQAVCVRSLEQWCPDRLHESRCQPICSSRCMVAFRFHRLRSPAQLLHRFVMSAPPASQRWLSSC